MTTPTVVRSRDAEHPLGPVAARALDLEPGDAAGLPALLDVPIPGVDRVRLTALRGSVVVGGLVGTILDGVARLDLVVVDPAEQRRGAGRALLAEWEAIAAPAALHVGGDLHTYAWPGVDIRYTAGLSLLLRSGYRRESVVHDMDVALPVPAPATERPATGAAVRRARPSDREAVHASLAASWSEVWTREVLTALDRPTPTLFVAERDGAVVGFAAHAVHRRAWFGPLGTDVAVRGLGVGDALQRAVLEDMAAGGVRRAQIGWVAEDAIPFYSRTIGARLGRCYWTMTKGPE